MSSEDYLSRAGWWPRKGVAPRSEYVGAAVCAECHSELVRGQQQHAMAHSSTPVTKGSGWNLDQPAKLTIGPAHYAITSLAGSVTYKVTYQGQSFSVPLAWAFGSGHHGQSFLFRKDGVWYEARISVFKGFGGSVTPGESGAIAHSLAGALGRKIPNDEVSKCFGCHATAAVTNNQFNAASVIPGVSCEECHGPGAAHVALAHAGTGTVPGMIYNPGRLDPATSVDFCGSCHRTWWDVSQMVDQGINVVRFPVYRLEQSKCWANGDARLTCIACHNPHKPLATDSAGYDQNCLACHMKSAALKPAAEHPAPACPVQTSNCTSCHMPKYEIPQMHSLFTDHRIRVVRDAGIVPND